MANTDDDDWDHFKEVFDPFLNGNYETIENFINQITDQDQGAETVRNRYLSNWKNLQIQFRRLFSTKKEHLFSVVGWKDRLLQWEKDYQVSEEALQNLSLSIASSFLSEIAVDIIGFLSSLNASSTPFYGGMKIFYCIFY